MGLITLRRFIKKTFKKGNVIVTGLRGTGKDTLFAAVTDRRKELYISNMDYQNRGVFMPLNLSSWDVKNNYHNFIRGTYVQYEYPYPEGADHYLSDAQLYFPSNEFTKLQKEYPEMVNMQALSRHLFNGNIHCNTQNLERLWDKIREQSDMYIRCEACAYIPRLIFRKRPKWVIQIVTLYDKAESCQNRVQPFRPLPMPLTNKNGSRALIRAQNEALKRDFEERNGLVKRYVMIYKNRSKYNTRYFKSLLKGGLKYEKA